VRRHRAQLLARLDHLLRRDRIEQAQLLFARNVGLVRLAHVVERLLDPASGGELLAARGGSCDLSLCPHSRRRVGHLNHCSNS
jgi:hypothetical protein